MHADTETLLMFAARREHVEQVIRPALLEGQWVISDRFTDASYAYQGGGRGMADSRLRQIEQWTLGDLEPDLTLLFDLDPVIAKSRQANVGLAPDRFEQEQQVFFRNAREKYLQRAATFSQRIKVLDAALSVVEIRVQIKALISSLDITRA